MENRIELLEAQVKYLNQDLLLLKKEIDRLSAKITNNHQSKLVPMRISVNNKKVN